MMIPSWVDGYGVHFNMDVGADARRETPDDIRQRVTENHLATLPAVPGVDLERQIGQGRSGGRREWCKNRQSSCAGRDRDPSKRRWSADCGVGS